MPPAPSQLVARAPKPEVPSPLLPSTLLPCTLAGLEEVEVERPEEMEQLLMDGIRARATAAMGQNAHSSRSHAIFTLRVRQVKQLRQPAAGPAGEASAGSSSCNRGMERAAEGGGDDVLQTVQPVQAQAAAGSLVAGEEVMEAKLHLVRLGRSWAGRWSLWGWREGRLGLGLEVVKWPHWFARRPRLSQPHGTADTTRHDSRLSCVFLQRMRLPCAVHTAHPGPHSLVTAATAG